MYKFFSTGSRGSAPGGVWGVPTCSLPLAAAGGTKNLHMALVKQKTGEIEKTSEGVKM